MSQAQCSKTEGVGDFSIETHRYRNGETPQEIHFFKSRRDGGQAVGSIDKHGVFHWHYDCGSCFRGKELPRDLVPAPAPPRYWSKAEDVDPAIERIRWKDAYRNYFGAIVFNIEPNGLVAVATAFNCPFREDHKDNRAALKLYDWSLIQICEYRRIGETTWRPCVVTT